MEWQQVTCVVTGAASGIGRAVAELLIGRGATVLAADRDGAGLDDLAERGAVTLAGDLTDAVDLARLTEEAGAAGVTHLVNAAGIIELRALEDVDPAMWDRIFAVNARALFFLSQGLAPLLPPGGAIVNVASTAAKTGTTLETAVYAATKAAVLSITRTFAHRYAPQDVRVNAVCPGIIDTPMQDKVLADIAQQRGTTPQALDAARLGTVPLGRSGSPLECATVIAFLLSADAGYMTGQAVNVSGGLVTW